MTPQSMLLVLPVPFRMVAGALHVEGQAANGLDRWADHFAHLTVAAPLLPESEAQKLAGFTWKPFDGLEHHARIACLPLPWAFTPGSFCRALPGVRRTLSSAIQQSAHLQFAIGGLLGDWASVAALEAIRQRRRFAIHTDRVEHQVMKKTASSASRLRRLKIAAEAPLMARYHRHIIRRCSLGLWHGDDCFRAYSPWCAESHLVHDVHTKAADLIHEDDLLHKVDEAQQAKTLRLCYAGRLDPMKAPLEWLQALAHARDLGVNFTATWFGDGTLRAEAEAERHRLGLDASVRYAGFLADRAELLAHVRQSHALVFTHITPESPRNLLESLVSGTPILGYNNAYAANLLEGQGGGALVPIHQTKALGQVIAYLTQDRAQLARMITAAASNGRRFTDAAVFTERSNLIKRFA